MTATMKEKTNTTKPRAMDVSERLLQYTLTGMMLSATLPEDIVGTKLASGLLDSVVSAYLRHGEAEGSPSAKEFALKFREALTELRKSRRMLQLIEASSLPCDGQSVRTCLEEVDILIRIFFSSIRTLENKAN